MPLTNSGHGVQFQTREASVSVDTYSSRRSLKAIFLGQCDGLRPSAAVRSTRGVDGVAVFFLLRIDLTDRRLRL